jgi:hypothetical protein
MRQPSLFPLSLLFAGAVWGQKNPIYENLPVGKYAVGFKTVTLPDYSRITKPGCNYWGEKNEGDRSRKITIHLWYPAKANTGKRTVTYGDLSFALLVAGKDNEAAKYYEKAVAPQPNGHDFYNLACANAKYGDKDRAFAALDNSLKYGYGSKQLFENDADLTSLKTDDRFKKLLMKDK